MPLPEIIPVDLTKTGGRLEMPTVPLPPGATRSQRVPAPPEPAAAPAAPAPPAAPPSPKHRFPEPSPDDVQLFLELTVRGERFVKAVSLFGGTVAVTFQALSAADAEATKARALGELRAVGGVTAPEFESVADRHVAWQFALSVMALRVGDKTYVREERSRRTPEGGLDHDALLADVVQAAGSDPVLVALRAAYVRFSRVIGGLEERADDPRFFTATRSGGPSPASPSAEG